MIMKNGAGHEEKHLTQKTHSVCLLEPMVACGKTVGTQSVPS